MNNRALWFLRWLAYFVFSALLPSVSLAQGVSVMNNQRVEKAKVEVGFTHIGKATKVIETPWGSKDIYDPLQDICVKESFESLYYWANSDGYFQTKSPSLRERSRRDYQRDKEISKRQGVRYLSLAKHESLLQLQKAGCSFVETMNCTELTITLAPKSLCTINGRHEYPFLTEMIGDPMRGSLEEQFELYFKSACSVWSDKEQ